jgi:hypothetical protein
LPAVCSDWHSGVADSMSARDIAFPLQMPDIRLQVLPTPPEEKIIRATCRGSPYKLLGITPSYCSTKRGPGYRGNRAWTDTSILTVLRLKPRRQGLLPFTSVAADTTTNDVFPGNDSCVIDYVLPGRLLTSREGWRLKADKAIHATSVSSSCLTFEPVGNVPAIH